MSESRSCDTVRDTIMATLRTPQLPECAFSSVDHGTLTQAGANALTSAMLVRFTNNKKPRTKKKNKRTGSN